MIAQAQYIYEWNTGYRMDQYLYRYAELGSNNTGEKLIRTSRGPQVQIQGCKVFSTAPVGFRYVSLQTGTTIG